MRLGYNTNGLSDHRWDQALELMAEVGYQSVAITIDHHCLNPFSPKLIDDVKRMRRLLDRYRFTSVVETGARFLLNPRQKHEPTLVSPTDQERAGRIDFLRRCIDIAHDLGATAVSCWSGVLKDAAPAEVAWQRLTSSLPGVLDHAAAKGLRLAFEPEPGMFVETLAQFQELNQRLGRDDLGLTLDIGHVHCVEAGTIAEHIHAWRGKLLNVHIEDMVRGVHEHLRFGAGTIDFPPVLRALQEIGYAGGVHVELSRHSHMAPEVLRESFAFLSGMLRAERGTPGSR